MARNEFYENDDSVAAMMLADLNFRVIAVLQNAGVPLEEAKAKACDLIGIILAEWGGIGMYLPKRWAYMLSSRDLAIYEQFDGQNYTQLALKHDLSDRQIRNIVDKGRLLDSRLRQGDLFPPNDE